MMAEANRTTSRGVMVAAFAAVTFAIALLVVIAVATKPAHAAAKTFTVNSSGDTGDQNPGDGLCATGNFIECTLRAAIEEANANKGKDTINFGFGGTGVRTISPGSPLPEITKPVTIDGYTQSGATKNTLIEPGKTDAVLKIVLDGPGNASHIGLNVSASNSTVKGLVINGFSTGINVDGGDNNVIAGNFIGTDVLGTSPSPNLFDGVLASSSTDFATNNTIGGTTPAARNLIAGNGRSGIALVPGAKGTKVQGNLIGTKTGLDGDLGNGLSGVVIEGVEGSGNTIGGNGAASNTIAFNALDGVTVFDDTGNRILGNSIFFNGGLGIDLGEGGVTDNDEDDPDTGANKLQNYPVLTFAETGDGSTTIRGSLNSTPGKRFTLQFFSISSQAADPSGFGEGQTFLGQKKVETNKQGNASFTFVPNQAIPAGQRVTATATGPGGNTSEFSKVQAVSPPP